MYKGNKKGLIIPVVAGLLLTGIIISLAIFSGGTGEYTVTADTDFTEGYIIDDIWLRPCIGSREGYNMFRVFADKDLKEVISEYKSYKDVLRECLYYEGGVSVRFGYKNRMREVYVSVPDRVVYAALADPILIDMSEALNARTGETVDESVYIDGELAYTVKSRKATDNEIAILIKPEAGQEFSVDGSFANGGGEIAEIREYPHNLLADRAVFDGVMTYSHENLVSTCEHLLDIEADALDNNCALFYERIDSAPAGDGYSTTIFKVAVITRRFSGGVVAIDPKEYEVK